MIRNKEGKVIGFNRLQFHMHHPKEPIEAVRLRLEDLMVPKKRSSKHAPEPRVWSDDKTQNMANSRGLGNERATAVYLYADMHEFCLPFYLKDGLQIC